MYVHIYIHIYVYVYIHIYTSHLARLGSTGRASWHGDTDTGAGLPASLLFGRRWTHCRVRVQPKRDQRNPLRLEADPEVHVDPYLYMGICSGRTRLAPVTPLGHSAAQTVKSIKSKVTQTVCVKSLRSTPMRGSPPE